MHFDFKNSVYYPACGNDGGPIKYFSTHFTSFFYTDFSYTRELFEDTIAHKANVLRHYVRDQIEWLSAEDVFLDPESFENPLNIDFFACWLHFRRTNVKRPELPENLEILFTNCEGVAALKAYRNRSLRPKAATYIRVGLSLGMNYPTFRENYARALDSLGSVPHLISDGDGLDPTNVGYYFPYSRRFGVTLNRVTDRDKGESRTLSLCARSRRHLQPTGPRRHASHRDLNALRAPSEPLKTSVKMPHRFMPTYKRIQEYVKLHHNKSVKTCHIADLKSRLGYPMRPRIGNRPRKYPCPEKFRPLIEEAFNRLVP